MKHLLPDLKYVQKIIFHSWEALLNIDGEPGTVAYAYNPSYSGGRDQKDYSSSPAGKKVSKTLSQQIK
jgi:hypothetical protein